jgi:hypothetical protein
MVSLPYFVLPTIRLSFYDCQGNPVVALMPFESRIVRLEFPTSGLDRATVTQFLDEAL